MFHHQEKEAISKEVAAVVGQALRLLK